MTDSLLFKPPRRLGIILQAVIILVLFLMGIFCLRQAAQAPIGIEFLLYLVPILLAIVFLPLVGYRAYALWRASYLLERDGIYLRWGLREVVIPMDAVTWVRLTEELDFPIPSPWFRWPGAVLGIRRFPDGTRVEYLAAQTKQLILIAASEQVFAISPSNPEEFILAYQRFAELGSLTPLAAYSIYPANLLRQVWAAPAARYLLLAGAIISLSTLVFVSLMVPSNATISLGFNPEGQPTDPGPSVFLLLLPLLNGFYFLASSLFGLYLFRSEERRGLAYLLWGSASFTGLLFILAVVFILIAS